MHGHDSRSFPLSAVNTLTLPAAGEISLSNLESICVTEILNMQITYPSSVAPLKISSARKWQRRGPAKIQTSKLEVPSLTQTSRWRWLCEIQLGVCWGPWGSSLMHFAAGCPDTESRWAVTITGPIHVLGFKDTFLMQITALLGQSNRTWWQTGANQVLRSTFVVACLDFGEQFIIFTAVSIQRSRLVQMCLF